MLSSELPTFKSIRRKLTELVWKSTSWNCAFSPSSGEGWRCRRLSLVKDMVPCSWSFESPIRRKKAFKYQQNPTIECQAKWRWGQPYWFSACSLQCDSAEEAIAWPTFPWHKRQGCIPYGKETACEIRAATDKRRWMKVRNSPHLENLEYAVVNDEVDQ